MPVIIRKGRLKFCILPMDHRPAHVHVYGPGAQAKFDIQSGECIEVNGFSKQAVNQLTKFIMENQEILLQAWRDNDGEE